MFPSHPLLRRFENELTIGEQKLEWTTRGADLVARPADAPLDMVWCWPTESILDLRGGDPKQAQEIIKERAPCRFYALDSRDSLLLKATHGFLRSHKSPLLLRFALPRGFWGKAKILEIDTARLHELKERMLQHDELRLVQELAGQVSSPWKWFEWRRGSLQELEHLVIALFVLAGGGEFSFSPQSNYAPLNFHEALRFYLVYEGEGQRRVAQSHQASIADVLSRFFEAHANAHIERLYLHPKEAFGGRACRIAHSANEPPSAHQRLEAMMVWRDFLRGKMPPEEIEALLQI